LSRFSLAQLTAYGILGLPLAMAALPIYVHVPKFYSDLGMSLAAIGGILLVARLLDAILDPLLGLWSDRARGSRFGRLWFVGIGMPLLALGMLGLFNPVADAAWLAYWFIASLSLVYVGFSMATISYQAYGAELSADSHERTRITAMREGLSVVGVLLAAALPEIFAQSAGMRAGFAQFAALFAPLALACCATMLLLSPRPPPFNRPHEASGSALRIMTTPFHNRRFNYLLAAFLLNGIAAAIPATLVLFFVQDIIGRSDLAPQFLIAYFLAGAVGMPGWVWLARRIGKRGAWLVGMALSVLSFVWAFNLAQGDVTSFMVICILSGFGLGADLSLPPSILADVIDDDEQRGKPRNEGAYFGLWNLVTKLNLALAAGMALPLLAWFGYVQGSSVASKSSLTALSAIYALLPSALKICAAIALSVMPNNESVTKQLLHTKGSPT
jgi:glycoside/pentoside/hexuronide:cation symporter, GPH family